jgi:hypothetical protein
MRSVIEGRLYRTADRDKRRQLDPGMFREKASDPPLVIEACDLGLRLLLNEAHRL